MKINKKINKKMNNAKKEWKKMARETSDWLDKAATRQYRKTKRWTKRVFATIKRWTKAYVASCIVTFIGFYLLPSDTRQDILDFFAR